MPVPTPPAPVQGIARGYWGARSPKSVTLLRGVRGLAVHYSAMNADEMQDHANCAERVRGIQRYHMDAKGWADIAYSWVACKHGGLFTGRGAGVRTAANGTDAGNDRFLAVCFLGDDTPGRDDITDAGREAIKYAWTLTRFAHPEAVEVVPHSQFKPTSCPGDELRAWIAAGMATPATIGGKDMLTKEQDDALHEIHGEVVRIQQIHGAVDALHPEVLDQLSELKRIQESILATLTRLEDLAGGA